MWLIVAILAVPFIEIALFILVGGAIGLWATLGLVAASFLIGVLILRGRGFGTMLEVRRSLDRGQDPAAALVDGALSVLAGLLLIVPGFLTDAVAVALLLPPVRSRIRGRLQTVVGQSARRESSDDASEAIDGTWHEIRDDAPPLSPPGPSGWTRH